MSRNGVTEGIGFVTLNTGYELNNEGYVGANMGRVTYDIEVVNLFWTRRG